jgi:hypothetical protein
LPRAVFRLLHPKWDTTESIQGKSRLYLNLPYERILVNTGDYSLKSSNSKI